MEKTKIDLVPLPREAFFTGNTYNKKNVMIVETIDCLLGAENYKLIINEDRIQIHAGDQAGLFYGKMTLEQLKFQFGNKLPCMEINDGPVYAYRSFHIDTARHFVPVDSLKKMIEAAAAFKLNKFHWHFSDDQGWRIESIRFPELHEIGARRNGDYFGQYHSQKEEFYFYSRKEVTELVEFCYQRGIEVVPEIDLPGHVTAILASHPELSCRGNAVEVAAKAGIFYEILCPGREETFHFLTELIDDMCDLFPGKYFHIGGDETPKNRWSECPLCKKRMEEEGLVSQQELQGYMSNRIAAHLKSRNKTAIVWNEAALGGNLRSDIIVQLWNDDPKDPSLKALSSEKDENGRPTSPNQGIGAKVIKAGGNVIISNMLGSYCDYPYAFISLEKIYNARLIPQKCEEFTEEAQKHIQGVECLIWTEHIRDEKSLQSLAWPRFAAKAEIGWSGDRTHTYPEFKRRMKLVFPYLKTLVPYATEPAGWKPNIFRSIKEMLAFAKNISKKDRDAYADAQKSV